MNVRELISELEKLDGDLPVILPELADTDFSPLETVDADSFYDNGSPRWGFVSSDPNEGIPCVVLWPVN